MQCSSMSCACKSRNVCSKAVKCRGRGTVRSPCRVCVHVCMCVCACVCMCVVCLHAPGVEWIHTPRVMTPFSILPLYIYLRVT